MKGQRVLLVDDDAVYRETLKRALERRGYEVLGAGSTAEALSVATNAAFGFASIDLRMPGASGLELVRTLAAREPRPVIVVVTGYGSIATAVGAVKLGAAHYLAKPVDADDLDAAFHRATEASPEPIAHEVPSLARAEWEHIQRVLSDCNGNISRAARLLKIERKSLQRKLAKYPVAR